MSQVAGDRFVVGELVDVLILEEFEGVLLGGVQIVDGTVVHVDGEFVDVLMFEEFERLLPRGVQVADNGKVVRGNGDKVVVHRSAQLNTFLPDENGEHVRVVSDRNDRMKLVKLESVKLKKKTVR